MVYDLKTAPDPQMGPLTKDQLEMYGFPPSGVVRLEISVTDPYHLTAVVPGALEELAFQLRQLRRDTRNNAVTIAGLGRKTIYQAQQKTKRGTIAGSTE